MRRVDETRWLLPSSRIMRIDGLSDPLRAFAIRPKTSAILAVETKTTVGSTPADAGLAGVASEDRDSDPGFARDLQSRFAYAHAARMASNVLGQLESTPNL